MSSDAEKVRQFTVESREDQVLPNTPQLMSKDEVFFLIKMLLDEIMELGSTVAESMEVKYTMIDMITKSKNIDMLDQECDDYLIAEQGDALVDCYYYSLDAAAKKGVNISKIFDIVHSANMNKRDPKTGKFIKREDGKIIKPEGWKSPDIVEEIIKQKMNGSFEK